MQRNEFANWIDKHAELFPDIMHWLAKHGDETHQKLLDRWFYLLRDIPFDFACRASDEMYKSDERPKGYGDHPRWIIKHWRNRKEAMTFARYGETFKCNICMDVGAVSIYMVGEPLERCVRMYGCKVAFWMTTVTACKCQPDAKWHDAFIVARDSRRQVEEMDRAGQSDVMRRRLDQFEEQMIWISQRREQEVF